MPVIEIKAHLVILDGPRVLLLQNKGSPLELRGAKLHAAKVLFDLDPRPKPKPDGYEEAKRANSKLLKQKSWLAEDPEHIQDVVDKDAAETMAEMDVIEPAPERHWTMPEGITRNVTTRNHRYDGETPGRKVLRAVAEIGRPTYYREVRGLLTDMKTGTIGSQLFTLAEDGLLLKEYNVTKKVMVYSITDKGEDFLTRPDPQTQLDLHLQERSS